MEFGRSGTRGSFWYLWWLAWPKRAYTHYWDDSRHRAVPVAATRRELRLLGRAWIHEISGVVPLAARKVVLIALAVVFSATIDCGYEQTKWYAARVWHQSRHALLADQRVYWKAALSSNRPEPKSRTRADRHQLHDDSQFPEVPRRHLLHSPRANRHLEQRSTKHIAKCSADTAAKHEHPPTQLRLAAFPLKHARNNHHAATQWPERAAQHRALVAPGKLLQ